LSGQRWRNGLGLMSRCRYGRMRLVVRAGPEVAIAAFLLGHRPATIAPSVSLRFAAAGAASSTYDGSRNERLRCYRWRCHCRFALVSPLALALHYRSHWCCNGTGRSQCHFLSACPAVGGAVHAPGRLASSLVDGQDVPVASPRRSYNGRAPGSCRWHSSPWASW